MRHQVSLEKVDNRQELSTNSRHLPVIKDGKMQLNILCVTHKECIAGLPDACLADCYYFQTLVCSRWVCVYLHPNYQILTCFSTALSATADRPRSLVIQSCAKVVVSKSRFRQFLISEQSTMSY